MMDKSQVTKAFEKIAQKEGISVNEVRQEIEIVIDDAIKSNDPAIQAFWKKMKCSSRKPTPEEVVIYLAKQIKLI